MIGKYMETSDIRSLGLETRGTPFWKNMKALEKEELLFDTKTAVISFLSIDPDKKEASVQVYCPDHPAVKSDPFAISPASVDGLIGACLKRIDQYRRIHQYHE